MLLSQKTLDATVNGEIDRVNRRRRPFAFVFHKDFRFARVTLNFNPGGAFDIEGFHRSLRARGITWKTTRVGRDYMVYHDFSKPFTLPEPASAPPVR